MEREVSSVVNLAITLIALAVVISLVSYTMLVGTQFTGNMAEDAARLNTNITSGQLKDLSRSGEQLMSTASIYNICSQEHDYINSITYYGPDESAFIGPANGAWGEYNSASEYASNASTRSDAKYTFPEDYIRDKITGKSLVNVYNNSFGTFDVIIEKIS